MKNLLVTMLAIIISACQPAYSADTIGEVDLSNFSLWGSDSIIVQAFDDPTIRGVSCYITYYDRASWGSEDSGQTSIACRQTGKISGALVDNPDVFSQKLNMFFKNKRVARFYDKKRGVLTYLAYTRKWSGSNKSHSLSVVVTK